MKTSIKSRKLARLVTFSIPGHGYIYADLNSQPGTLGIQICSGGSTFGSTLSYRGDDQDAFERICRKWLRSYVRDCEPAVTFGDGYQAHTMTGGVVTVPDQVAADQKRFDSDVFPVIRRDGSRARARLMGEAYGLHTSGTGDMVVAIV